MSNGVAVSHTEMLLENAQQPTASVMAVSSANRGHVPDEPSASGASTTLAQRMPTATASLRVGLVATVILSGVIFAAELEFMRAVFFGDGMGRVRSGSDM